MYLRDPCWFFWRPLRRTLALSFQNLLSGFQGYATPSCRCILTTLFLLVSLCFSSSLSYHNSMPAASTTQVTFSFTWVYSFFTLSPAPHRNAFFSPRILTWSSRQGSVQYCLLKSSGHLNNLKTPIPLVLCTSQVSTCFLIILCVCEFILCL